MNMDDVAHSMCCAVVSYSMKFPNFTTNLLSGLMIKNIYYGHRLISSLSYEVFIVCIVSSSTLFEEVIQRQGQRSSAVKGEVQECL